MAETVTNSDLSAPDSSSSSSSSAQGTSSAEKDKTNNTQSSSTILDSLKNTLTNAVDFEGMKKGALSIFDAIRGGGEWEGKDEGIINRLSYALSEQGGGATIGKILATGLVAKLTSDALRGDRNKNKRDIDDKEGTAKKKQEISLLSQRVSEAMEKQRNSDDASGKNPIFQYISKLQVKTAESVFEVGEDIKNHLLKIENDIVKLSNAIDELDDSGNKTGGILQSLFPVLITGIVSALGAFLIGKKTAKAGESFLSTILRGVGDVVGKIVNYAVSSINFDPIKKMIFGKEFMEGREGKSLFSLFSEAVGEIVSSAIEKTGLNKNVISSISEVVNALLVKFKDFSEQIEKENGKENFFITIYEKVNLLSSNIDKLTKSVVGLLTSFKEGDDDDLNSSAQKFGLKLKEAIENLKTAQKTLSSLDTTSKEIFSFVKEKFVTIEDFLSNATVTLNAINKILPVVAKIAGFFGKNDGDKKPSEPVTSIVSKHAQNVFDRVKKIFNRDKKEESENIRTNTTKGNIGETQTDGSINIDQSTRNNGQNNLNATPPDYPVAKEYSQLPVERTIEIPSSFKKLVAENIIRETTTSNINTSNSNTLGVQLNSIFEAISVVADSIDYLKCAADTNSSLLLSDLGNNLYRSSISAIPQNRQPSPGMHGQNSWGV